MIEQLSMWQAYASHVFNTPHILFSFVASFLIAIIFYLVFRHTQNIKHKVVYLYAHILFLFAPFILSAVLWNCLMSIMDCTPKVIIYLFSVGSGIILVASFIALPYVYNWATKAQEIKKGKMKQFISKQSKLTGISEPKLHLVDDLQPYTYSITNIKPSIFVSVGLCEILGKKEMEALLLHEIYHIRSKTSFWRFSINMLKAFSPLSTFIASDEAMDLEEKKADLFATRKQGTKKFLRSAKNKINKMNKKINAPLATVNGVHSTFKLFGFRM